MSILKPRASQVREAIALVDQLLILSGIDPVWSVLLHCSTRLSASL